MHVLFHFRTAKHERNPVSFQLGNIHLEDLEFQSDEGHVMA